jgi:hypothetical protein
MEGSLVAYKVFTNGSVLNASEINDNLMRQSVMVFSNEAARTAAITSPVEGMVAYLEDTNLFTTYNGSSWKNSFGSVGGILEVVTASKSNTFSTSSTSYVDVTDLSVTITPKSTSSIILVNASVAMGVATGQRLDLRVMRGATPIGVSADGNTMLQGGLADTIITGASLIPDSPNTASAVTYKVQIKSASGGDNVYVNRRGASATPATFSSLIVMEVSA